MTVSPFIVPPTTEAPIRLAQLEHAALGAEPESGLTTLQAIRALGAVLDRYSPAPGPGSDFRTDRLYEFLMREVGIPDALRSFRAMSSYVRALAEARLARITPSDGSNWR